jgi:integrase
MKTQSQLTTAKSGTYTYIYVYYRLKNKVLRISTGNKVISGKMTKDNFYTTSVVNYAALNQAMKELKRRVDQYITTQLSTVNPVVNQKDCEAYINENNWLRFSNNVAIYKPALPALPEVTEAPEKTLLEYYNDFFSYKQKELAFSIGVKDYKSLNNALIDFEKYTNKSYYLSDINNVLLIDFRNFLVELHNEKYYVTKGGMNDNTINKRIIALKTFFKYLEANELTTIKKDVYDFKAPSYSNDVIALTKTDIKEMINVKTENNIHRKILDILALNCFMGLRYSDFSRLKKEYFKQDQDGDFYLELINRKTDTEVIIPLSKTALNILEKYNFDVAITTNQNFNRMIKEVLVKYDLFSDTIVTKRKVNRISYNEIKLRRDVISFHSCRRTFITIAANENIPLPYLMNATGHRKIATLQRYMQRSTSKEQFKKMNLE